MSPMNQPPQRMGSMPQQASQMPAENAVDVDIKPSGQDQLTMTIQSPGGTFDVTMTLETATMFLVKFVQVVGQMAGMSPEQIAAELGGAGGEGIGGTDGGGGLAQLAQQAGGGMGGGMPQMPEGAPI